MDCNKLKKEYDDLKLVKSDFDDANVRGDLALAQSAQKKLKKTFKKMKDEYKNMYVIENTLEFLDTTRGSFSYFIKDIIKNYWLRMGAVGRENRIKDLERGIEYAYNNIRIHCFRADNGKIRNGGQVTKLFEKLDKYLWDFVCEKAVIPNKTPREFLSEIYCRVTSLALHKLLPDKETVDLSRTSLDGYWVNMDGVYERPYSYIAHRNLKFGNIGKSKDFLRESAGCTIEAGDLSRGESVFHNATLSTLKIKKAGNRAGEGMRNCVIQLDEHSASHLALDAMDSTVVFAGDNTPSVNYPFANTCVYHYDKNRKKYYKIIEGKKDFRYKNKEKKVAAATIRDELDPRYKKIGQVGFSRLVTLNLIRKPAKPIKEFMQGVLVLKKVLRLPLVENMTGGIIIVEDPEFKDYDKLVKNKKGGIIESVDPETGEWVVEVV